MQIFQCKCCQASSLCKISLSSRDWDYTKDAVYSLNHACKTYMIVTWFWSTDDPGQLHWNEISLSPHLVLVLLRDLTQFPLKSENAYGQNNPCFIYLEIHIDLDVQVADIAVIWLESEYTVHLFSLKKPKLKGHRGILRTLVQVRYSSR